MNPLRFVALSMGAQVPAAWYLCFLAWTLPSWPRRSLDERIKYSVIGYLVQCSDR